MTSSEYFTVGCGAVDTVGALLGREPPALDPAAQRRIPRIGIVEVVKGDRLASFHRLRQRLAADELPAGQLPVEERDGEEDVLVAELVPGREVGPRVHA